jgi:hypothetical protein
MAGRSRLKDGVASAGDLSGGTATAIVNPDASNLIAAESILIDTAETGENSSSWVMRFLL